MCIRDRLWAYIPDASLFENLGNYYNDLADAPHVYGLDGEIAFDVRRDPATQEIDKAVIFVGQRRGGKKYFAIDIENAQSPTNPVAKLWTINEGDLPRMGQSWATPVLSTINFCEENGNPASCGPKEVLVIAGGLSLIHI